MSRSPSADTERRVPVVEPRPDRTVRRIAFVLMIAAVLSPCLSTLHLVLGAPWPWQLDLHAARGATLVPS